MTSWNKYMLAMVFLIAELCMVAHTAMSTYENQNWWIKRTRKLEKGCAGMCCSGKNSTCSGTGPLMGNKISSTGRCFCDASCLDMNDCCLDYSVQCQGWYI